MRGAKGLRCPNDVMQQDQLAKARELLQGQEVAPKDALKAIAGMEMTTLEMLAGLLPSPDDAQAKRSVKKNAKKLTRDSQLRREYIQDFQERAYAALTQELALLQQNYVFPNNYRGGIWLEGALKAGDLGDARGLLDTMTNEAQRGQFGVVPRQQGQNN